MSMTGRYLKLSAQQLQEVIDETVDVNELVWPQDGSDPAGALDIDKTWHVIHFLLTGEAWGGEAPLANAVLGGTELPETDAGYGPFRYLLPEEVQAVSKALAGISPPALWARFDPQTAEAAEIYGWEGDEKQCEYVSGNYQSLQMHFAQAATAGQAMLLHLS